MKKYLAEYIAKITEGTITAGDSQAEISGFCIDSRKCTNGDLFIPLKGKKADGHKYIESALENDANAYLYSNGKPKNKATGIKVDDPLKALQKLASFKRNEMDAIVIAITGSTGKTTVKNILESVLKKRYRVFSSPKNFNTEIGLPLAILMSPMNSDILLLEMGMRGKGQIKELSEIANPDMGLITNINQTHISLLGSEEEIAKAKSELLEILSRENKAFLNADDKWVNYLKKRCECKIRTFGCKDADITAEKISYDDLARPSFTIREDEIKENVNLKISGKYNIENALAATIIARELGMDYEEIIEGLESATAIENRMNLKENEKLFLVNDYYNASPYSTSAALDTLISINVGKRKVVVLGDMLELGKTAKEEHEGVLKKADKIADKLILVGDEMKKAANTLGIKALTYNDSLEAGKDIINQVNNGDVILLKASRAMKFENIAEQLEEDSGT